MRINPVRHKINDNRQGKTPLYFLVFLSSPGSGLSFLAAQRAKLTRLHYTRSWFRYLLPINLMNQTIPTHVAATKDQDH